MQESKRQKQVAKLINEEMSDIFQREGLNVVNGGLVSISKVSMTPDLLEARIYLSLFKFDDPQAFIEEMAAKSGELRGILGNRLKNQLRRIPELKFFNDDTLDYVFKMEGIFKKLEEERQARDQQKPDDNE